jgi:Rrf2 family iron-sulfur cluster assembly transcriptional regulator
MQLSTRGRYAVMAMLDLAHLQSAPSAGPVALAQIAERQALSLSYLEQLFAKLRRAGLVRSVRGPGGGYSLSRPPADIWLNDIIAAVSEETDMTRCGGGRTSDGEPLTQGCVGGKKCNAHHLWVALGRHMEAFVVQVNLAMVLNGEAAQDFTPLPAMQGQVPMQGGASS